MACQCKHCVSFLCCQLALNKRMRYQVKRRLEQPLLLVASQFEYVATARNIWEPVIEVKASGGGDLSLQVYCGLQRAYFGLTRSILAVPFVACQILWPIQYPCGVLAS